MNKSKKKKRERETNSVDLHEFCARLVDKAGLACVVLFCVVLFFSSMNSLLDTKTVIIKKHKDFFFNLWINVR